MSADSLRVPPRQARWWVAVGLIGAGVMLTLALLLPIPEAVRAAVYLLVFSVVPGASLLALIDFDLPSVQLHVITSAAISVALLMGGALVMAYSGVWLPEVATTAVAAAAVAAGGKELTRAMGSRWRVDAARRIRPGASVRSATPGEMVGAAAPAPSPLPMDTSPPPPLERGSGDPAVSEEPVVLSESEAPLPESGDRRVRVMLEPAPSVLLATDDLDFERLVRKALEADAGMTCRRVTTGGQSDPERISHELARFGAGVVAIGPDLPADTAIQVADLLSHISPQVSVLVATTIDTDLWDQALLAGVQDVIWPSSTSADVRQMILRAADVFVRESFVARPPAESLERDRGRVVTVLSPKGGSGKTALAVNVAAMLERSGAGETAIVDLDYDFGDVAESLALKPEHSIADAVGKPLVDEQLLRGLLSTTVGGLSVLAAPSSFGVGVRASTNLVVSVIDGLAHRFAFVVIDTPGGLPDRTLMAVDRADDIILIADRSVAAVRGLASLKAELDSLGLLDAKQCTLVLNRGPRTQAINNEEVEAAVGIPVTTSIPSSLLVPRSMNAGVPLVESSPQSPVAQIYRSLANLIVRAAE